MLHVKQMFFGLIQGQGKIKLKKCIKIPKSCGQTILNE